MDLANAARHFVLNRLYAMPSTPDENGCVYRLVELANRLGFNWGGSYRGRLDGMHFEVTKIMTPAEVSQVLSDIEAM